MAVASRQLFVKLFASLRIHHNQIPVLAAEVEQVEDLFARASKPGYKLTIDLNTCKVTDAQGLSLSFDIDPSRRHCLLNGLDDIALTLQQADKITAYEKARGMQPV